MQLKRTRLTFTLLASLATAFAACGEPPMDNPPPDDVDMRGGGDLAEALPDPPPTCSMPPVAQTQGGACMPAPCDEAHRYCKEKYVFADIAGAMTVELRGSYRGLGWDVGYPMTKNGANWEAELHLPFGKEAEVKFVVNGKDWYDDKDPKHPGSKVTPRCTMAPQATCEHQELGPAVVCDEVLPPESDFDWRDAVMYFAFIDRFFNGATTNDKPLIQEAAEKPADYLGGDYAGLSKKIDEGYFTDLGVNALWITVPFDNPDYLSPVDPKADKRQVGGHPYTGYHGYWPNDQWPMQGKRVEEHFGTEEELKQLIDKAHGKGIKVIFDYAMVHVYEGSDVFKAHAPKLDAMSGLPTFAMDGKTILDAGGMAAWFWPNVALNDDMSPLLKDGKPQQCVCGSQGDNPCQWDGTGMNPLIGTRCAFQGYLPHWNYDVDGALEYSLDAAVRMIKDTGVDGFRADAVKHISPRWYRGLRTRLVREFPNKRFFVTGETYDFGSRANLGRFVDPSSMLDGQFDFPLRANLASAVLSAGKTGKHLPLWELADFIRTNDNFYGCAPAGQQPPVMSPWVGNHDVVRPIHVAENKPLFDEWANGKADDPAQERTWANLPQQTNEAEAYERLANAFAVIMTGPGAPLIYYGDEYGLAGGGDPDNRRALFWKDGTLRGAVKNCHQMALYDRVKKLTAIRKAHPALRRGKRATLEATDDLWVFSMTTTKVWRTEMPETVYVVINRGDAELSTCALPMGDLQELIGGATVAGPAVKIPPRQTRIFIKK
jgi:glycosidase